MRAALAVCLGVLLAGAGCVTTQSIEVTTDPPGAQVTLVKYGQKRASGGAAGVSVTARSGRWESRPIELGASPLSYDFDLDENVQTVSGPGVHATVRTHITEGLIRAEKGGKVAEKRVRFTGDPIRIHLVVEQPGTEGLVPRRTE